MAAVQPLASRWEAAATAAREATSAAAGRAGVELREVETLEDVTAVADLLGHIWERPGEPPMPIEMLRAFTHSGNYVVGAHHQGRLIGALVGFMGRSGESGHLHSHILGVRGDARISGVGFALKQHQRMWALERRIDSIIWTFDPLVRGNAYFNITKLGAVGQAYRVNFYGAMPDVINSGDESDRLVVRWRLTEPLVEAAACGEPQQPGIDALRASGAVVALAVDHGGAPVRGNQDGEVLLVQVPRDAVALRQEDAATATAWRHTLREVMTAGLARGLAVTGMSRDGWYVLSPPRH